MLIKCEKCSTVYNVPEVRLQTEHPHFLKCTHCGFVFDAPNSMTRVSEQDIPRVAFSEEQGRDTEPMALEDIFKNDFENETQSDNEKNLPTTDVPFEEAPRKDYIPDEEESTTEQTSLFTPLPNDDVFAPVEENKSGARVWIFLVAFMVTFISILYLLYVGRFYFVRQTPVAETLYQKAGISTEILGSGLSFQNTLFDGIQLPNGAALRVKSELVNTTDKPLFIPTIVLQLTDKDGAVIHEQSVEITRASIEPAQRIGFEAGIPSLPENAHRIEITFKRK